MSIINFGTTVSLIEAANLIMNNPKVRFLVRGEPGIGKSALLGLIKRKLAGTHLAAYIDVPNMDLGDIAMPIIDHERKVTRYYPNARFRLTEGKPVVIMLDEFTKGAEPVKNLLHPLLEVNDPRLGDVFIDDQSIIFMTGNLGTDGVGDNLKAHTRNRIVEIHVRKPNADEWLEWAMDNQIEAPVMAWVERYPHCLASYLDDDSKDNLYCFNPRKQQGAYVSGRSLAIASNIVATRELSGPAATVAGLKGCIGEAAARDMQAFIEYQDQLTPWKDIIDHPKTAKVPKDAGACSVLVFGAITKVEANTFKPFVEFLERMEPEWQAVFFINICKSEKKRSIAWNSSAFVQWTAKNQDVLSMSA